jgi:hypothetical protein
MSTEPIDLTESYLRQFIESKRPKDLSILKKLDFEYSYDGKAAIFYEVRPAWKDPEQIMRMEFAKMRYIKSQKLWKLYWMRASGKWELYEPFPSASNLPRLLVVIKEDQYGCFFG